MIPRRRAHLEPDDLSFMSQLLEAGAPTWYAVARFEDKVARHTGARAAVAVSSGRKAMTLILQGLGVGPGDEVIVPAYTLKDLVPLIRGLGARPVAADIDPDTFNIDVDAVARRITSRTRAILALHIFGAPCDIERLVALGDAHDIPVIEDCAHALGATVRDRQVGTFGRAGFFSFETTKPVNTFGGGMVVTGDLELARAVRGGTTTDRQTSRQLRQKINSVMLEQFTFFTNLSFVPLLLLATPRFKQLVHRSYRRLQHAPPAHTQYLPVQAELGLRHLRSLDARIDDRQQSAARLRGLLSAEISVQEVPRGTRPTWYFFVVKLPVEAAPVRRRLLYECIDAGIEDEIADNCAALLEDSNCPNVERVCSRLIALPMFEGMTERQLVKIARAVNGALRPAHK